MEWEQSRESTNIEDRRGQGGGGFPVGGGGGLGIGAILILAAIGYFTGIDPRILIGGAEIVTGGGGGVPTQAPAPSVQPQQVAQNDPMRHFVAKILGQTEDVWTKILPEQKGIQYTAPTLVL